MFIDFYKCDFCHVCKNQLLGVKGYLINNLINRKVDFIIRNLV